MGVLERVRPAAETVGVVAVKAAAAAAAAAGRGMAAEETSPQLRRPRAAAVSGRIAWLCDGGRRGQRFAFCRVTR